MKHFGFILSLLVMCCSCSHPFKPFHSKRDTVLVAVNYVGNNPSLDSAIVDSEQVNVTKDSTSEHPQSEWKIIGYIYLGQFQDTCKDSISRAKCIALKHRTGRLVYPNVPLDTSALALVQICRFKDNSIKPIIKTDTVKPNKK
jgi:hypothetical protein